MVEVLRQDLSFLFFFFCLCLGFILLLSGVERLPRLMVEMASCLLKRLSGNQLVTMNKRISVCSVGYDYLSIGVHFTSVLSNINLDLSFDFFCLSFVRKPSVGWPSVCDWLWVTKTLSAWLVLSCISASAQNSWDETDTFQCLQIVKKMNMEEFDTHTDSDKVWKYDASQGPCTVCCSYRMHTGCCFGCQHIQQNL